MTLKNGFCKCSLFVLSANGWKDQNKASSFSRQICIWYGEGIVRLANRVTVRRQSKVSVDFWKVLGHEVFSPERSLNQSKSTRVCICSINQSNGSISVRLLFLFCSRVFISRSHENRWNKMNQTVVTQPLQFCSQMTWSKTIGQLHLEKSTYYCKSFSSLCQ